MPKCAAVLLFILLTVWVFRLLSAYTHSEKDKLYLTPILTDANGWDIYTMENGTRREISTEEILELDTGNVFYLSRILTKEQENAGYTFLMLDFRCPCAVFLDGELFYTNCPPLLDGIQMDAVSFPQDYTVTPPAPGESIRCTLPAHFAGKRLTIATAHVFSEYGSSIPFIKLSSYEAESEPLIADLNRELIPAVGYAVIALFLSGIWLFAFLQEIRDYSSLLLILAALMQTLSHLRQLEFLTPSSYAMDSPLAVFIPIIEVLFPLIWLLLQMEDRKCRRIFGGILGISAAVSMIFPVGGLFGGLPFYSAFLEKYIILFCPLSALLFFAVREAVHNRNRIFTLLLSGLCMTVFLIVVLYIASLCGEGFYADQIANIFKGMDPIFFHWCAIILFFLSAVLALYQIIRHISWMRTDLALQAEHTRQLDSRLSAQRDFYEARLAHEDAIRSLRHDMAGHLNTIALLLQDDKTTEAKKYLDGIIEYHKEQSSEIFCQNPYMNAVLQNYAAKCRKQHIELVCHIGIKEEELPATELCLILNNALENALEGSLTMPEGEKIIKVQAAVRQNQFLLRVSNRFDGHLTIVNGLPVSEKEREGHGYGLSNIRQAAERRGGHMSYYIQDGYFVLDVAFGIDFTCS